jgi:P2-related tail formation protein
VSLIPASFALYYSPDKWRRVTWPAHPHRELTAAIVCLAKQTAKMDRFRQFVKMFSDYPSTQNRLTLRDEGPPPGRSSLYRYSHCDP